MTDKIVVLSTCESKGQASKLAQHLVKKRLAACVNVFPGLESTYRWKDKIETAKEWLLVIKTRRDLFSALRTEIEQLHTYEVPEVIALPVVDGAERYLTWMDGELMKQDE
jgi:periplasmic divalent cation tolerance protein